MTLEQQVDQVISWMELWPDWQIKEFKESSKEELISYFNTLGRLIRNKFELWEMPWEEEIVDGIDISPNHTEAISMIIIESVWEKLNKIN